MPSLTTFLWGIAAIAAIFICFVWGTVILFNKVADEFVKGAGIKSSRGDRP